MKKFSVVPFIMLAVLLMFSLGCEPDEPWPPPNIEFGEMTDARDSKTYKTIEIGAQTWMAENLNYETGNSWCYDNNPENCKIYGRLYDWNTALSACPSGWHLPSDAEWTALTNFLWGNTGGKMKSTSLWNTPNTGATNESGWSGLPGGNRYHSGNFGLGSSGYWWSSTESSPDDAWYRHLYYYFSDLLGSSSDKAYGFSVRCLRD